MLAALVASGQTPSAFARARGFGPYRVSYWRARLDERREPQNGGGFVPVTVRGDVEDREVPIERRVEVTLSNGRVVTFAGTWDPSVIAPWLHALDGER
jgi:hypothetical protein